MLPPRAPVKVKPRGDFDPETFRRLIFQNGAQVLWQARAQCPCGRKVQDVATDMDYASPLAAQYVTRESPVECPLCKGVGFYLHSDQNIRAIFQDMRVYGRRFSGPGEYGAGSARVTLLPEHKPALGDRFTVQNSVILVREDRQRGATAVEALRFPVASQQLDLATGLQTFRTLQVHKADVDNKTTSLMVLVEGTDFVVDGTGKIDWTLGIANGKAPAANSFYTVSYYANPRYVVVDLTYGVRDTFVGVKLPPNSPKHTALPTLVVARQEWLGTGGAPT